MMDKQQFIDYLGKFTDGEKAYDALINQNSFFRLNTIKVSGKEFKEYSQIKREQIPFWENAFQLNERINLGKSWEYFLGYLHPQSLSSMIPPLVLNPNEKDYVLDLTAAPGSKTTQMSAMMNNKGVIVANDLEERQPALFGNITRLGVVNTVLTNRDAKNFKIRNKFTKVLLDAPCTALGGEKAAHLRYEPRMSESLSKVQQVMMFNAFDSLRPGGTMVYSTCTFAPEENEHVVQFILDKREEASLEEIKLEIPHEKGIDMENAWRIYPQHLGSEGFFIAKIAKGEL